MLLAVYKWFTRNFLTCQDAARLVSESCERNLTFSEKLKLKILCIMCPYTDRYDKQVGLMHNKLGACCDDIGEAAVSRGMSDECKARLKAELSKTE
ncbi:hypothetical protein [Cerasicoccus fimbriatus]|uniref:hypothetical protein n=1 Tax=Cerasicoccus fimbriatus TaxID=3014554 RepID=UPI0022B2E9DC|nr:hypothetical protein [Cerasicoccus sp. TK19100]